ncbi:MAG: hypothetical protein PHY93_02815 [Bacteriovorax sp.]|nr:hypothetical protein [Bacteriovorax sp.]
MKSQRLITLLFLILLSFVFSCSHQPTETGISIVTATSGLMKNRLAPFPVYLTNSPVNRTKLEKKYSSDIFIIHTGHILKPDLSKAENEKSLEALSSLGINLVNLTLEDFVIAESQEINFENYNQAFLNSSVIDLNRDDLATAKNIHSYEEHGGMAFIGLSDSKIDKKLLQEKSKEKYIINDYVLSILKVKKVALKNATPTAIHSFIIVHTLGNEINEVMARLPPTFINSLAD